MEKTKEAIIGTVLAASKKSYGTYHLIFTSSRIVAASAGWRKNNIFADMANMLFIVLAFPFQGPSINTDSILMREWSDMKKEGSGRSFVMYHDAASQEILDLGLAKMVFHSISLTPYSTIRKVILTEDPIAEDCRLKISAGFLASSNFLIPSSALQDFKGLMAKTPLAHKLEG